MFNVQDDGVLFHRARDSLLTRPWAIDNVETLCSHMKRGRYKKVMMFVDNAGSDVILGQLPFARQLLISSVAEEVVIAANSLPSINDITFEELDSLLSKVCKADDKMSDFISKRKLRVIPSGNDLPVIDLRNVSQEVVKESEGTDLVVLEGMGRSIETNLNVVLSCDSIRIGMVKHKEVATALGGRMLDCVVKFIPGFSTQPQ